MGREVLLDGCVEALEALATASDLRGGLRGGLFDLVSHEFQLTLRVLDADALELGDRSTNLLEGSRELSCGLVGRDAHVDDVAPLRGDLQDAPAHRGSMEEVGLLVLRGDLELDPARVVGVAEERHSRHLLRRLVEVFAKVQLAVDVVAVAQVDEAIELDALAVLVLHGVSCVLLMMVVVRIWREEELRKGLEWVLPDSGVEHPKLRVVGVVGVSERLIVQPVDLLLDAHGRAGAVVTEAHHTRTLVGDRDREGAVVVVDHVDHTALLAALADEDTVTLDLQQTFDSHSSEPLVYSCPVFATNIPTLSQELWGLKFLVQ